MTAPLCLDAEVRQVPGFPTMAVTGAGAVYGPKGRRKTRILPNGYAYILVGRRTLYIHHKQGHGTQTRGEAHGTENQGGLFGVPA